MGGFIEQEEPVSPRVSTSPGTVTAADSCKPLALINRCQREQAEGWDGDGIGDWFGAEDGGWDLVLLCSGLQHLERTFLLGRRVAAREVGALVRKQGLLGV